MVMSSETAEAYIQLLNGDQPATLALLVCSVALQLDDQTAHSAVELVVRDRVTDHVIQRVKRLGCVWKEWNGFWHVTEDVRPHFVHRLYEQLPRGTIISLHNRLAEKADARAAQLIPDCQLAVHEQLMARFEAVYQRLLIPGSSRDTAKELIDLWRQSPLTTARALALSVDHLSYELNQRLGFLPDEVVFLQGMAARDRNDATAQEEFFQKVWHRGRSGPPSYVHAVASSSFALLIQHRDPRTAENALRDSIDWSETSHDRGLALHKLGNLLARNRSMLQEAEAAYNESLNSLQNSEDRGQVFHSLQNLIARDPERWLRRESQKGRRVVIEPKSRTKKKSIPARSSQREDNYPYREHVAQEHVVNKGQRDINGALCYVDWHVIHALKTLVDEVAKALPQLELDELRKELGKAYYTSERVADIKAPGCGTDFEVAPEKSSEVELRTDTESAA
jgi:hypothetical protein